MKGSYRSGGFLMLGGKREMMCPSVVSGCCTFPDMKTNKRSYRVGGFGMFFGSRGIWMLDVSGRAKKFKIV